MKKIIISVVLIASVAVSTVVLSAFTSTKQEAKNEVLSTDDPWKPIRENVTYCNENDVCEGTDGTVWVNTKTYQVAISKGVSHTKYDLTEYRGINGYNMRFWNYNHYSYVNIFIPQGTFN